MSATRVAVKETRRKEQVKISATAKELSSLMSLLGSPTDPDDRLAVRGEALVSLWAKPLPAFVQSLRPHTHKKYDASRGALQQEVADMKGNVIRILRQDGIPASQRLREVAQELVRFRAFHVLEPAAALTSTSVITAQMSHSFLEILKKFVRSRHSASISVMDDSLVLQSRAGHQSQG